MAAVVQAARAPTPAPLSVVEHRGVRGFQALRDEWNRALAEGPADLPFARHEWIDAWLAAFAAGREPLVLAARDGAGRAHGFAIFLEDRQHGVCALTAPVNDHSCRYEWALGAEPARAVEALWGHLRDRSTWDVLQLPELSREGPTFALLSGAARRDGHLLGVWDSVNTPYLSLDGGDPERRLSSKFVANLRRRLRRLCEQGDVAVRRTDSRDGLEAALERFLLLEASGWKGKRGTAIALDPRLASFYTRIARAAADGGWLAMRELTVGGKPIAMHLGLRYRGVYSLPKPAYDEAHAACSPGQLLFREVLAESAAAGCSEVDFLGPDMPWKRDWEPRFRQHAWLYVYRPGLTGRALHAAKHRLRPFAKEVLRWWRR
ncbi:MAG TPA: GNAT family N-acetyltransferase [Anaeromyxobacteraceae bacterium]|nr:GNAT family N-acetyltransferase [Anaeromyxobacteraceae bacterium]